MAKGIDFKLDKEWSRIIKGRGECELCQATTHLNAHHVVGRRNRATRWLISNGCCLCPKCHVFSSTMSAHQTPTLFSEKIIDIRGEDWHWELTRIANTPKKWTKSEKEELLNELKQVVDQ